jgi:uracil-DNA glycosylase
MFLTPLDEVKVVILGQDPYPDDATGLAFSCDVRVPASLRNIFNELKREYPDFEIPSHGNLTKWALQGVLLMNTCLTVPRGKPKGHMGLWKGFAQMVISVINNNLSNIVFMLWGKESQSNLSLISNKYCILETSHPSPMSFNRGFNGCDHFKKANEYLKSKNRDPIDWCSL